MKRRILAWIMTFMIVFGTMPNNIWTASAETGKTNAGQIGPHYAVNADGSLPETPTLNGDTSHHYGVSSDGEAAEGEAYDDVIVDKTISQTGTENEFQINLEVTTKQKIQEPDIAVAFVVDVSTSMDEYYGYNSAGTQITRIQAAQDAMKKFVEEFGDVASSKTKREIAITKFCVDASTVTTWVDVTTEEGRQTVYDYIDTLHTGVGPNSGSTADNWGTNIEGGLLLGRNQISVQDIEDKHVILLSDGGANSCVLDSTAEKDGFVPSEAGEIEHFYDTNSTSITAYKGSWYNSNYHYHHKGAVEAADKVKDSKAVLHTVYCGNTSETLAKGDLTTPGDDDCDYCDTILNGGTYNVTDFLNDISDEFVATTNSNDLLNNILELAREMGEAWVVTDPIPMGNHIEFIGFAQEGDSYIYDAELGAISWDLKGVTDDDIIVVKDETTGVTTYKYTVSYYIRLDNVYEGFNESIWHNTNNTTSVPYVISKTTVVGDNETTETYSGTAYFNIPSVNGYTAELDFQGAKQGQVKVGSEEIEPLEGAEFSIRHSSDCDCGITLDDSNWKMTATSNEDGDIHFENIPSGHTYVMTETSAPDEYKASTGEYKFSVAYGVVTEIDNTLFDDNGQIVNEKVNTVTISGTKTWKGGNSNSRPTVTINLYANGAPALDADGNAIKATVNSSTDWKYEFKDLPKYDADGNEIEYTIVESPVDNYYPEYDGYDVKNIYSTKKNITVQKLWDDANDKDGIRPENISVKITGTYKGNNGNINTVTINNATVVLSDSNNWTHTWPDLAEKISGRTITYTVEEVSAPDGYTVSKSEQGNTIIFTNTHSPEVVSVSGTKTWSGDSGLTGFRPDSITVDLLADGAVVDTKTVTAADGWAWEFTNLPKYKNGTEIVYTVKESAVPGYTTTYNGNDITNTLNYEESTTHDSVSVNKTTYDNKTVNGAVFGVFDNAECTGDPLFTMTGGTFEISTEDTELAAYLPADNGGETTLYLKETAAPSGYIKSDTVYTIKITKAVAENYVESDNKYTKATTYEITVNGETSVDVVNNELTTFTVKKEWEDNNNQDGKRPDSIVIKLIADGEETDEQIELSDSNDWEYTWSELPKYNNGEQVVYTVWEVSNDGYSVEYDRTVDGSGAATVEVTNLYTPEKTSVSVHKLWNDNNDQDGKRPESLNVYLYADDELIDTHVLTADKEGLWLHTWTDLPVYKDGKVIEYIVTEDKVDGYTSTSSYDAATKLTVLSNTYVPETTQVAVKKVWSDNDNQDGIRPGKITVQLKANDEAVAGKTVTLNGDNEWKAVIENLPKYEAGKLIDYTWAEINLPEGYKQTSEVVSKDENGVETTTITNTHETDKVEVSGSKVWNDGNDQYGNRPESITINLLANDEKIKSQKVTADDNWAWSFKELDKFKNGTEIVYKVEEIAVPGYTSAIKGSNIENTTEVTEVSGVKNWNDGKDQYGNRPESITINLLANDEKIKSQKVTADDNWAWSFKNLPTHRDGAEITYSVSEDKVTGYETEYSGYNVNNKLETINLSGTKKWNDNNNQDGIRPQSITVNLKGEITLDDGTKKTVELGQNVETSKSISAANDGIWLFEGLPKYAEGKKIKYTVTETPVEGYTATVSGNVITNTHIPEKTEVAGVKTWDDNNDQDGKRPESITINLLANGEPIQSQEVTADDGWAWSFENLDKFKDGKEINYSVREDAVSGYATTYNGYNITNSYTPGKTSVSVTKVWNDNNNQDGKRPEDVTVQLYANGTAVEGKTLVLSDGNKWVGTFTDLDEYASGSKIEYTVAEIGVDETQYEVSITGSAASGYAITNTHTPETRTITGAKTWDDEDNQDGVRPDKITVLLIADGEKQAEQTVRPDEDGNWTWEFTNLPVYKGGVPINYNVQEVKVDGYYSSEAVNSGILNTHDPALTNIEVHKNWLDDDNRDNIRPESISVRLLATVVKADGTSTTTIVNNGVELNAKNNWHYNFDGLPKYEDGIEIQYSVEEVKVPDGYTASVSRKLENVYMIDNVHEPETIEISGSKTWKDADDQDGVRPDKITVNLYADGTKLSSATATAENGWSWNFGRLPKYKDGDVGKEIQYTVIETAMDGYETTYDVSKNGLQQDIVNEHTPAKTSITVSKAWKDGDDQDGIRPGKVTVELMADGQPTGDKLVLKASEGWIGTFDNLPVNDKGEAIVYTVKEVAVDGYKTVITGDAVNGFVVTNSHTPETTSISGYKVWDDADNQDGIRPESITINVMKGDAKVASKTVTPAQDGSWTWTFEGLPKYDQGKLIEYTFSEETVAGYESSVEKDKITNTHIPETVVIKGEKSWDDADNQDGIRPADVTIRIMDGDKEVETVNASVEGNWKYTSSELPKYRDGKLIDYTVEEIAVDGYEAEYDGYDIKNTHKPSTIDIEGDKIWKDADDQDGKRPDEITVELYADGTKVSSTTATAENGWTYKFTDLPEYKEGNKITYTIEEEAVTDYSTSYDGYDIINSYTPDKTNVTVNKVWVDGENQDGIRPASVSVVLYADGTEKDTVELTAANGWTYTWEELDVMKAGEPVVYTVKEVSVPEGYTSSVEGFTITNTHEPATTNVTGTKTWNDADDQDGIRPASVEVQIYNGKVLVETVTAAPDAEGNWTYTSSNLPKYANGKEIHYTVQEVPVPGYTSVVSGTNIINTHVTETVDISGEKDWNDNKDQDGKRPDEITVKLLANGNEVAAKTVTAVDGWAWTFEDMSKFEKGTEIVYTITETVSDDYSTEIDGYDITNSYTPGETSVTVTKAWDDANNQDGIRPNSVEVQLYADGEKVDGAVKELNESNNWSASFTGLDEYANGELIEYTVDEVGDTKGYTAAVSGDAENGYVITNTHTPATTSVEGTKTWADEDDQDGVRPETLLITLNANGTPVATQEIDAEGDWKWSFTDLPKFENGKMIAYTVTEALPEGYVGTTSAAGITNTYSPELTSVIVTKVWDDANDQDGIRPDGVIAVLLADGESTGQFVMLNADNNWTAVMADLDKYKDGVAIKYSFAELDVEGYTSRLTGEMATAFKLINKHVPETVTVDGEKTWNDNDNQDGVRPEYIVINLLADGKEIDEVKATAENGWTWTFGDLPKYKDGKEIEYTVVEDQIGNYDTTINNVKHDVTNTHVPSKTTVTVAKKWNDSNDQDGIRPDSITVRLYADGEDIGKSLKLNESNHWVGTFNDLPEYADGEKIKYTVSEDIIDGYSTVITGKDAKFITVTNTHEPEKVDLKGSKTWDDADDQDGMRPGSITVTLLADGVAVDSATVTAADDWTWEFHDMDRFKDGKEIAYTVKESPIEGYTPSYDKLNITNTHEPAVTDIEGTKTWDDADDQDGMRPGSITVNLLANGEIIDFAEVTAADDWSWEFKDLPVYEDGEKIDYTIEEFEVEGYTASYDGYDITNTHEPALTDIDVTKTWDDADDQDGLRPESIMIKLLADGETAATARVTAADDWAWTFKDLPVYADGEKITYTVEEITVDGYEVTIDGFDITNTHEPQTIDLKGSKTWNDNDDQDGARPESIMIKLLANGKEAAVKTVTAEDGWAWTFDNMPKYENGQLINYTLTETKVSDYSADIKGMDITNTHTPGKTSITVVKAWDDNADQDGLRPESIMIKLLADGEETGATVELTASNNWTATFTDLDEFNDGEAIDYTVDEVSVEGYEAEISGSAEEGYVITNIHEPETTDITGAKTWEDNDNELGHRPESITVNLLADGTVIDTVTVSEEDGWTWTFEDLPVYADGEGIGYTIAEEEVPGYEPIIDGYNITNVFDPESGDIDDGGDIPPSEEEGDEPEPTPPGPGTDPEPDKDPLTEEDGDDDSDRDGATQTGDTFNLLFWMMLTLAGAGGAATTLTFRRKKVN